MKYNGIELKEFTSGKSVVFNPPRKMLVWDGVDLQPKERDVMGYFPARRCLRVISTEYSYQFCAEIPEPPKSRRATNRELAKWLAQGNGEKKRLDEDEKEGVVFASIEFTYELGDTDRPVDECYFIRRWDDEKWHEPTADYMGLEEASKEER